MGWFKRLTGVARLEKQIADLNADLEARSLITATSIFGIRSQLNNVRSTSSQAFDMAALCSKKVSDVEKAFMVGVDASAPGAPDKSWAVVCIHGKIDRVMFVDASEADARAIQQFLSQFSKDNRCVDAPFGMAEMLLDEDGKMKKKK